jgi:DNA-directed RNA polymerase subunit RPC12/RpoP
MLVKGCIRCGGDVYNEEDIGGIDLVCLQCGFRRSLTSETVSENSQRMIRWIHAQRPRQAA